MILGDGLLGHNNRFPLLFMKIGIFYFSRSFAKTWIKDIGIIIRGWACSPGQGPPSPLKVS